MHEARRFFFSRNKAVAWLRPMTWFVALVVSTEMGHSATLKDGAFHVYPGENIQQALEAAAASHEIKIVRVHAGIYRPETNRQALIWFNARHDGIHLEAEGAVTLTAANPAIARPDDKSYPAIVNHLVYFGNGVSSNTVLRGFKITGANNFVSREHTRQIERDTPPEVGLFFYTDGGAVKIYGHSYPTLDSLEIFDNYSSPCAGGVSIEHPRSEGTSTNLVWIRNCIFRNNRAQVTGAALDLLWGSSAAVENCLFVENISNTGADFISLAVNEMPFTNNGVLTVFSGSRVVLRNCTFTKNRNAVDDMSRGSEYRNSIFWDNTLRQGLPGFRYELDVKDGDGVIGCRIQGERPDVKETISREKNKMAGPPPDFQNDFSPRAPEFSGVGYRPINRRP
jgi:hypothetical protein